MTHPCPLLKVLPSGFVMLGIPGDKSFCSNSFWTSLSEYQDKWWKEEPNTHYSFKHYKKVCFSSSVLVNLNIIYNFESVTDGEEETLWQWQSKFPPHIVMTHGRWGKYDSIITLEHDLAYIAGHISAIQSCLQTIWSVCEICRLTQICADCPDFQCIHT